MIECEGLEFPDDLMKEAFTLGQKLLMKHVIFN
jgi:hypothetical protein